MEFGILMRMKEAELNLEKIYEGGNSITFNPPLKLDIYLCQGNDKFNYVNVNFDFGMSYDFGLHPFYIKDLPLDDWIGRTKRIIEFELFHSFFHYSGDPNYSTLNWALYGNLAHRVTCEEDYSHENISAKSVWTYNKELCIVEKR